MRTSTTQIPLGTPLNRSHPLSQRLVGCWPLNEGGGQKAMDSCISTNFGTLTNGAIFTQNKNGNCISFDGTDDYVATIGQVTTYAFIQNTQVFTISAWLQLNNNTARQYFVNTTVSSPSPVGVLWGYETIGGGNGTKALRIVIWNAVTTQLVAITQDNIITDLNWHHVVVTGGGSGNAITFYVDGIAATTTYTTSFAGFSTANSNAKLEFGRISPAALNLNGRLNNIMIYNRTLSATEVRQLYTNPYQMFQGYKSLKK